MLVLAQSSNPKAVQSIIQIMRVVLRGRPGDDDDIVSHPVGRVSDWRAALLVSEGALEVDMEAALSAAVNHCQSQSIVVSGEHPTTKIADFFHGKTRQKS